MKVRIIVDEHSWLIPWEIAITRYPMPEAAEELVEFEAVELPEGYEPNLEIQQLINASLEESSTMVVVDLDKIDERSQ